MLFIHNSFAAMYRLFAAINLFVLADMMPDDFSKEVFSNKRFANQFLNSDAIRYVGVRSAVECVIKCSLTVGCESVNYCKLDDDNTGNCSLNSQHICEQGAQNLKTLPGCNYLDFIHHVTEKDINSVCGTSPCKNGGTCGVLCGQKILTCECQPQAFGSFCENVNGGWGIWSPWTTSEECSSRTRQCDSPPPVGLGRCEGRAKQWQSCG